MPDLSPEPYAGFIENLSQALGAKAVVTDGGEIASHCTDWRHEFGSPALCVVRPTRVEDVATIIRMSRQHGIAIVPQGGNTSLAGGSVPYGQQQQIVMSLSR